MKPIGLYLHFPFCVQKCRYCDFPSCAGREDLMVPYLEALFREMESYRNRKNEYEISTIFMGGGTPTLFDGHSLSKVTSIWGIPLGAAGIPESVNLPRVLL